MKGEPPRGLLYKGVAVASYYRLFMCICSETVEKLDCTWTCAAWGKNLGWGWAGQGRGGGNWGEKEKPHTVPLECRAIRVIHGCDSARAGGGALPVMMSIIRSSRNPRLPQLQPLSARYNLFSSNFASPLLALSA